MGKERQLNTKVPVIRLFDMPDDLRVRLTKSLRDKYILQVRRVYGFKSPSYLFFQRYWSHKGPHKSDKSTTISIGMLKDVTKKIGISQEEIEANVQSITKGGGVDYFVKFPLVPDEDHAWLIGLHYSSGGFRHRPRDRTMSVLIEPELIERVLLLGERIGNVPRVEYNAMVSMNGRKWPRKRLPVHFNRVMYDIFPRLGLKAYRPIKRVTGGWTGPRHRQHKIPGWILADKRMMHSFVEGYLNGIMTQSWLYSYTYKNPRRVVLFGGVHVRFIGNRPGAIRDQVVRYLNSIGITGIMIHQRRKERLLKYWNYDIYNKENIARLLKSFRLYKTDLRVRCQLMVL